MQADRRSGGARANLNLWEAPEVLDANLGQLCSLLEILEVLVTADSTAEEKRQPVHGTHAGDAASVIAALASTPRGLSSTEAERRLRQHGPNSISTGTRRHPVLRFLAHFNNALIYFLLAGAAAAAALGHFVDTGVILAVVLVNAIVGFLKEGKAEDALAAIRDMIAPRASVLRDGQRISVPQANLVVGDVVLIEAGDRVPADLRLLRARSLRIDEAILTGESVAATKHTDPVDENAALGDRRSLAFSGTLVAAGQGTGIVFAQVSIRRSGGSVSFWAVWRN